MSVLHSVREKHPACGYALRRIIALIPVLLGVTFLTYGLMYLSPKDPVEMMSAKTYNMSGEIPDKKITRA